MAEFIRVARLEDLPPDGLLGVEVDGREVVLARVGGRVYAVGGICSHQEARLAEGSLYDGCLMCPVHGGEFDVRTGEAVTTPATEPIATYEVRVEDGAILVARPG